MDSVNFGTTVPGSSITGWCSTHALLLICSSFSRENGHPLLMHAHQDTHSPDNVYSIFLKTRLVGWRIIFGVSTTPSQGAPSSQPNKNSSASQTSSASPSCLATKKNEDVFRYLYNSSWWFLATHPFLKNMGTQVK